MVLRFMDLMRIRIDNREHDLLKHIKELILNIPLFKELEVLVENLPLGDIIISNKENDKLYIERKTINDLSASIKDGRYEEQSYRLNGLNHPNHNIIYLIEGDINRVNRFKDNKMEKLTLYSSIFSLNYYKGFSVIRTFSIDETAIFICNTANKLRKGETENKQPYYQNTFNGILNTNVKSIFYDRTNTKLNFSADISPVVTQLIGSVTAAGTTVTGTGTSFLTDLVVGDPLIYIGANNNNDLWDLGFVASYKDSTYYHTGLARDHTDGIWKFFDDVVNEQLEELLAEKLQNIKISFE